MAEPQSNAPLRADTGAPTSGVIRVRTRLTANFTVLANALAQRPGSAVTVGVAAYILSLPDGAPVSIPALCAHFTEGEILISRALRELETAGYLERRRVRGPGGRFHTRTYAYDVPGRGLPSPPPPTPPLPRMCVPEDIPGDVPARAPAPAARTITPPVTPSPVQQPSTTTPPPPPLALADADPQAVAILASLRIVDRRLVLSRREVAELAPAVADWLAAGISAEQITQELTFRLPDHFLARPAKILAYRLSERPLDAPAPAAAPTVLPWQTCDGGCDRPFRAAQPGRCRDCPPDDEALDIAC
ncbi:hypothetical protein AB0436_10665 [Streptomyces sp. NPDC051322]|uniref:hypothetical protein n=1 Tax=Streptomyces sp. NPDC051322 TaxID=3154645 RepID=UPI00344E35D2